jgi:glutathionyl-hydroquinone reductase
MGLLVNGEWKDQWYDTSKTGGKFVRSKSQFENQIINEENAEFKPESNRYHLYISHACPWAHRALIFRKLKKLEEHISLSVVHPLMLENGWTFQEGEDVIQDNILGSQYMHQVYTTAQKDYTGRVTVPVLWDKKKKTIVNNESSQIIRIFNSAFNNLTGNEDDYYPKDIQDQINEINNDVYHNINNGVYKTGFATTKEAYEETFDALFKSLDNIERILKLTNFLVGNNITEADWRLFTTLIRFDAVYFGHFKCNKKRISDYPKIYKYLQNLFNIKGIKETIFMDHIKIHYYASHTMINPTGIVPKGPDLFF